MQSASIYPRTSHPEVGGGVANNISDSRRLKWHLMKPDRVFTSVADDDPAAGYADVSGLLCLVHHDNCDNKGYTPLDS